MRFYTMAIVGLVAIGLTGAMTSKLLAQDAAALVEERQQLMKGMGKAFGPVMPIAKGENDNVAAALNSAVTFNTNAKKIVALFPPGTGRDVVEKTRAKPTVWSERAEFEAAAARLVEESAKLIDAVNSNDVDAFRRQFKAFGAACGGCHDGPAKSGGKFRYEAE